jgi:hypothetical protein
LTETYFASFTPTIFGFQTWSCVVLLKRDDDPVIAIKAACTGALAASAYLRVIFLRNVPHRRHMFIFAYEFFELVEAPWPKDDLYSQVGCHLLLLRGFISDLLPHMRSVAPTSLRVVWETLPQILNRTPQGDPEPHLRKSFLAVWAELESLAGTEPPALPSESAAISGSEPIRFKNRVMDADGLSPVERLISILRPTANRVREQEAAAQEDAQDAQDDHAVPVALLPKELVGESSSARAASTYLQRESK